MIIKFILEIAAIYFIAQYYPAVSFDGLSSILIFTVVLAFLNIFVAPIIKLFTLPINLLTLGLFSLVINALMIMLADNLMDGFTVDGFSSALIFAVLLSLANAIIGFFRK